MNWFVFWIAIYTLLLVVLTLKYVKKKDFDAYLINNRKTKLLPLVFTTLATFVGGGVSMGLIAMGYASGFAAIAIGIAYVIGFFILYFFAARIRKIGKDQKIYSFAEFLNKAFLKNHKLSTFPKAFSGLISGINIIIFFFLTAAQFVGMATLLHYAFDVGYVWAAAISFLVVIVYTAFAGLSGVIITDSIQFVIIIIMIFAIFIPGVWSDTSGFENLKQLPSSFLNGTHEGLIFLIGLPLLLSPSVLTRMDIWQRTLAAGSEKIAKRNSVISGFAMLPFYIIFPLVGMALRVNFGPGIDPNHATHLFLENNTNAIFLGFAIVGLLAALMSSADSFLNIVAMTAVRDFTSYKDKGIAKDKVFKRVRIAVVVFGAVALAMALYLPDIVELFIAGITLNIIFTPITFLALIKKDVYKYKYAAFASILSGAIVITALFTYGFISNNSGILKISFVPATIVATIAMFIGIWVQKSKDKQNPEL
ncbi:MAG: sodium:solute symporter family protein [Bacteroidales bacterium]|nr:sodium:solute symporter family protein [Bacteroidales bacterium]